MQELIVIKENDEVTTEGPRLFRHCCFSIFEASFRFNVSELLVLSLPKFDFFIAISLSPVGFIEAKAFSSLIKFVIVNKVVHSSDIK